MIKKLLYIFILLPLFAFGQEEDPCYSINDYNLLTQKANPPITLDLLIGWNMVGYGCREAADSQSIFQSISDVIVIAKDNIGYAYLPEWGYNGIGDLLPNQGYLVKMSESVVSFQICTSPINYHQIQGCMDCEAVNFSQWATINDRSCVYDSDYYGTNEAEEVIGCQDVSACDYNELATGEGVCQYAIEGYDCDGNLMQLQVGDLAEGGIVFYIDETGQHGLVAAMEDLDSYYEWGCYGTTDGTEGCLDANATNYDVDATVQAEDEWGNLLCAYTSCDDVPSDGCLFAEWGVLGTFYTPGDCSSFGGTPCGGEGDMTMGTGLQNTLDIVSGCSETPIAASEALAYEAEGYNDWYLPSLYELIVMYMTIGQGGTNGNLGGFSNWENRYWSSSENATTPSAFSFNFGEGYMHLSSKISTGRVRVIRAF
ncbi:MAG: DUF1566 domain-containing protein [Flavobacteriales bacterium]|nr:DUF1566 domain-containing protein [Flavobacteriales bacterium]